MQIHYAKHIAGIEPVTYKREWLYVVALASPMIFGNGVFKNVTQKKKHEHYLY
jgi:hypothetical protein